MVQHTFLTQNDMFSDYVLMLLHVLQIFKNSTHFIILIEHSMSKNLLLFDTNHRPDVQTICLFKDRNYFVLSQDVTR